MKKEMLINVLQPEECRIAIVEDGVLEELYVERASQETYVGNIYKGKIVNIEASIQAAFVDFGIGRNGFLHVSDVDPVYYKHLLPKDIRDAMDAEDEEGPAKPRGGRDRGPAARSDRPDRPARPPEDRDRDRPARVARPEVSVTVPPPKPTPQPQPQPPEFVDDEEFGDFGAGLDENGRPFADEQEPAEPEFAAGVDDEEFTEIAGVIEPVAVAPPRPIPVVTRPLAVVPEPIEAEDSGFGEGLDFDAEPKSRVDAGASARLSVKEAVEEVLHRDSPDVAEPEIEAVVPEPEPEKPAKPKARRGARKP
ncbi:MAG: hypothetical protein ACRC7O_17350, partial [Fimbriiglobus sp.]